ncbi:olfactory receptor 1L6-like [Myiozetetes cayanensis]|uniref:olfactory receptor 1L6-like n=1 Tax=Myiozetetes cayanensis TaxID=478635 RepID=UPI00215DFB5A|nr:olfactory receptor 1L6-like [Myiozetetes cayanensis]
MENSSSTSGFLLLAFTDRQELLLLIFWLFLGISLAALLGNGLIITTIACDQHLHSPMYFFLLHLSLTDLGSICTTVPKAMHNSLWGTTTISYTGCAGQVFTFFWFACAEYCLLTIMCYDRYVAICKPLHYGTLLGSRACAHMAAAAWATGFLNALLHTANTFSLPLCQGNALGQFFCEVPQILKLICSDSDYLREFGLISFSLSLSFGCFIFIVFSYVQIFRAVLRIPSQQGRHKAFSTCLPHLAVVSLFISTLMFAYLKPPSISSPSLDLVVAVLYSVVPPALNPLIYSLRNQELKEAIRKLISRTFSNSCKILTSFTTGPYTKKQEMSNSSSTSGFLLLAFADTRELQLLIFWLFLGISLAALLGNSLIITTIASDQHLHSPRDFFLLHLSLTDLGSICTTVPKAMHNSLWGTTTISYTGCVSQVFLLFFFLGAEFALLSVMCYDRYVAICKPLHYGTLLGSRACAHMAAAAWASGFLYALLHTANTFSLPLCQGNALQQFFCEVPQIVKLSCSHSYFREIGLLGVTTCLGFGCFILIVFSYVQIFRAVLRIPSQQGRHKAFSTCLPHLAVVSIFVSTGTFAYLKPPSISSPSLDLMVSVLYSVVPPALNPLIYSLRNKEFKDALGKLMTGCLISSLNFPSFNKW